MRPTKSAVRVLGALVCVIVGSWLSSTGCAGGYSGDAGGDDAGQLADSPGSDAVARDEFRAEESDGATPGADTGEDCDRRPMLVSLSDGDGALPAACTRDGSFLFCDEPCVSVGAVSEGQIGLCRPTPDEISAGFARRVRDYGAWSGLLARGEFVFGPLAATQEAWLVDPAYEPYIGLYYCWFHGCLAAVDCDCDALRASSCVDGCRAPGLAVEIPWDRLPTELEGHAVTVVGRYVEVRIPEISAGPFVDPRYVCPR